MNVLHRTSNVDILEKYKDAEVGLSPQQLKSILEARNIIQSGGTITSGGEDIVLEPTGNFESVTDLKRTLIQLPQRQEVVYLEDLANVYRSYADPATNKMNTTGVACLGLSISMIEGGNVIALGEKTRALVEILPKIYPVGVDFHLDIFQPDLVDRKVNEFVENLSQAIVIVMLVMIFHWDCAPVWRWPRSSLPPMLITLLLMSSFDIGLDQISIASLLVIVGIFAAAIFGFGFVESGFIPKNIEDDWGPRTKKIVVDIHQARARRAGGTSQDVAVSLESGLSGFTTTEYREGDKVIPILLRSVAADRQDIGKLESLNVYAQSTGEWVPLKQIADARVVWESSKILRRDRYRMVTVQCDLSPGANAMAIFGLMFATALTLGVVPILYSLLFRVAYTGFEFK